MDAVLEQPSELKRKSASESAARRGKKEKKREHEREKRKFRRRGKKRHIYCAASYYSCTGKSFKKRGEEEGGRLDGLLMDT